MSAQETIKLSREEAETLFLQHNLLLISEKLHIESQQANVIQAKAWPNPEFSIREINLWKNSSIALSPPFFGSFGQNQQIAFEFHQLIQTAGKRKKLIALEQVDVSKAEQYFENLLRNLKLELRNQLTELQYVQQAIDVHQDLLDHMAILIYAYQNQLNHGNISKAEYIRLKAQELELNKQMLQLAQQSGEIQKELKLLLRLPPSTTIQITHEGFVKDFKLYQSLIPEQLIEKGKEHRPDYQLALLEEDYANKLLTYEQAQRIPDLTVEMNYDRNGSTMLDFVGIGVSFDLPLFNQNKGGIKKAQIGIENAKVQKERAVSTIENEISLSYRSLLQTIDFLEKIEVDYEEELDLLLENFTENFSSRQVSMLAYLDFIAAYLSNKKIILEAYKEMNQQIEEFHYTLGIDL